MADPVVNTQFVSGTVITSAWLNGVNDAVVETFPTQIADNTADIAQNTADIALRAPIASPVFTGNPTGPTAATGDSDTSLATTAFVNEFRRLINRQIFTSNGTWNKPTGCNAVHVICIGGGGGGGGAATTGAGQASVGGGGAGGSRAESVLTAGIGASETITIGAGGTGVAGGNANVGGDTSFGTLVIAKGGGGGNRDGASNGNFIGRPGIGTAGSTAQIAVPGAAGEHGMACDSGGITYGGNGAPGPLGGGGGIFFLVAGAGGTNGNNATANTGGGGGGAVNGPSQVTARTGGTGGSGIIIVDSYT